MIALIFSFFFLENFNFNRWMSRSHLSNNSHSHCLFKGMRNNENDKTISSNAKHLKIIEKCSSFSIVVLLNFSTYWLLKTMLIANVYLGSLRYLWITNNYFLREIDIESNLCNKTSVDCLFLWHNTQLLFIINSFCFVLIWFYFDQTLIPV